MADDFNIAIENVVRKAPADWLASTCEVLRSLPLSASLEFALQNVPNTNNSDLAFLISEAIRVSAGKISWEALGVSLSTSFIIYQRLKAQQHIELLWSGPSPANQIAARRIDQALYDLIANAQREILLVTFAAAKIERLTGALGKAVQTGVKIRLVLEFGESSEGQLSYDAMKAFPPSLIKACEVYYWPIEKRERNQAGRPGKLHAKVAIIDDAAIVSSANLTDDAFTRNIEIGLLVKGEQLLVTANAYFNVLIANGTLKKWHEVL